MRQFWLRFLSVLFALSLAGCSIFPNQTANVTPTPRPKPTKISVPVELMPTWTPAPSLTPVNQATSTGPTAQPTPDTRKPPEQWQSWPIVPAATGRALEIYRAGLAQGNDPRHFSKIGDCQSIREALMGIFDMGRYTLSEDDQPLQEAIDQFAGSFNRDGMAVQGGFNAASVLSPMWANPDTCKAGENPLECEFRINRPSFVIISLEVWWNGRTPERYEQYMRRIIEFSISRGVVPILSTKADNVEGDNSINLATAKLAYEYNLPLWNWWRAAQTLPNNGMDTQRNDGFHLAQDAWYTRSFTALQALDSVWRGVRDQAAAVPATQVPSPLLTPEIGATEQAIITAGPTETYVAPTAGPTPIGGSGKVLFGLAQRQNESVNYLGVYALDLQAAQKTQIAGAGYNFQSISPDGKRILINKGSELYVAGADGSNPVRISNAFFGPARLGALWLTGGQAVVFIALQDGQRFLVNYPLDGKGWTRLTGADAKPVELYPSTQADKVYWGSGDCTINGECTAESTGITTLSGRTSYLTGISGVAISPNAPFYAYSLTKNENLSVLVVAKTDGTYQREAPLTGNHVLAFSWSPDGKRLSVLLLNQSDYSGKWGSINHYLLTPSDYGAKLMPMTSGLNMQTLWSPDGLSILLTGAEAGAGGQGYRVSLRVVNVKTSAVQDLTQPLGLTGADLLLTTNIAWMPGR